jgi:hypothetical protein
MIKMCIKHYWENADAEIPVLNRSVFCNPNSDSSSTSIENLNRQRKWRLKSRFGEVIQRIQEMREMFKVINHRPQVEVSTTRVGGRTNSMQGWAQTGLPELQRARLTHEQEAEGVSSQPRVGRQEGNLTTGSDLAVADVLFNEPRPGSQERSSRARKLWIILGLHFDRGWAVN